MYDDLVDVVTMISLGLAGSPRTIDAPLAEWRLWARGFCAGLYCRRTADRAARAAWRYALRTEPMPVLAYAAASAAWAVTHAAEGDEMAARLAARSARAAIESLAGRPAGGETTARGASSPRSSR